MKKRIQISLLSVLFITLLFTACSKDENTTDPITPTLDVTKYFPLKIGAEWNYLSSDSSMIYEYSILSKNSEASFNVKFHITLPLYNYEAEMDQIIEYDSLGIYQIREDNAKDYLIKKPFIRGNTWVLLSAVDTIRYEIIEENLNCSVPAGTFTGCLKIKAETLENNVVSSTSYCTLAPNVGALIWDFGENGLAVFCTSYIIP